MKPTRTAKEIKEELARKGETILNLAQEHNLKVQIVYDLLNGRLAGARGESHRAAVILGLKEGELPAVRQQENAI